ncbi:MAG: hypothetical protein JNJ58_00750 [Chitinophagaceae bacterium]|nr:hypothetical protein [Chitinophagaceae bacterium]
MKAQTKKSTKKQKAVKVTRIVNIAVVLEDVPKEREMMMKMAAHDESLSYTICPKSPEEMYRYIGSLRKRGIQVGKMVLMGHGNAVNHHIGGFFPGDADIDALRRYHQQAINGYKEATKEQLKLSRLLKKAKSKQEKADIRAAIDAAREDARSRNDSRREYAEKIRMMDEMSDSMAPGARIGLFNCFAASDKKGEQFMKNIGEIFLHKHGGDILGCTARVWTVSTHPIVESLFGTYDTDVYTWGKWVKHTVAPRAIHCNGYHHKPTCTCGWGGPR